MARESAPAGISHGVFARRIRRRWRMRVRRVLTEMRLAILVLAFVATFVLGMYGSLSGYAKHWYDALFATVNLFIPGASLNLGIKTNWQLEIARAIAIGITGYAVLRGVLAVTRDQAQLFWLRATMREHTVVVGLGAVGSVIALALQEAGFRVAVVERDEGNDQVRGFRDRGIAVLIGDGADEHVLDSVRVGRARHVIVACGDDTADLDVLAALRDLLAEHGGSHVVTAFVSLDDRGLWRMLRSEVFGVDEPRLRVEFFNVFETAARRLVEHYPPFGLTGGPYGRAQVLVVGLEGVGPSLIAELAREWRRLEPGAGDALRITIADPGAEEHRARLLSQQPELGELCELVALAVEIDSPAFQRAAVPLELARDCELRAVYVCSGSDTEGAATAFAVSRRPELGSAPIVVAVAAARAGISTALEQSDATAARVRAFSVLASALTPELLRSGINETIAEAKHDQYVRAERTRGLDPADNPSVVPWDDLAESLKQSNRRFADGVGAKLRAAGCTLLPSPIGAVATFVFTEAEVEELGRQEHDRWVEDLRGDGWDYAPGEKDAERRLHPLLVSWEELPEAERDKDREPMRALPQMLAGAGFEVQRVGSSSRSLK